MASVRERQAKQGETTWQVLYRHQKRQLSKTFADPASAEKFRVLVDTFGVEEALRLAAGDPHKGPTVAELADLYLADKAHDVTPRTIEQYRRDIGNWVLPWFGHRPAESLDEGDIQRWVDHMRDRLSPKSVADRHMVLHSMYEYGHARSRRLVTHNPCKETALPKRKKKQPKGTRLPEFDAILAAGAERNPDARDLLEYLGETGWRFSEAAALPRKAVDLIGADVWVTVVQTFQIIENRQVLVPDEAKSWAAFRRIRPLPAASATVRRRIAGLGPDDLVFTNSRGRPWNQNTFLRDTWPGLLKHAGLWHGAGKSPTPHWLRHMHVAVCVRSGASLAEIQRRIGHESIQTTIGVYGGMVGDINDDAMARAADLMYGHRGAPGIAPVVRGELL